jgi:hypothetical protein
MPRASIALALATLLLACAGTGGSGRPAGEPLRREVTEVLTVETRVKAIDHDKRLVTLTDPDGGEATFYADEAVRNLPQVQVGDLLMGRLVESVVVEVREPTAEEAAEGAKVLEVAAVAEPGERPAGVFARRITAVLVIEAIDRAAGTATLRGPSGAAQVVAVRDPANLERVAVGDTVVATYTESLALEVRAPDAR